MLAIPLGAMPQATDIDLYKQLQKAVDLPLLAKAAPPNKAYEARLYMKSGDQIGIVEIASEIGTKHHFTLNTATNEVHPISGVKLKSNRLAALYRGGHYQFACSYGFYVLD